MLPVTPAILQGVEGDSAGDHVLGTEWVVCAGRVPFIVCNVETALLIDMNIAILRFLRQPSRVGESAIIVDVDNSLVRTLWVADVRTAFFGRGRYSE